MSMQILELVQGSPEWLAHRARCWNASDAPAMMGCSPYKTRAQLLRELHTGVAPDVDVATQKRFDNGHRVEALARPLAEEFIGAELYPVTGVNERYSASFDGLTMDERQGFEHKALNADLRAAFAAMAAMGFAEEGSHCRLLPIYHRVQMEHQLLVSGAERILFMTSEWTADGDLVEELHCWYYPDIDLRRQIVAGWAQLERDLAAYVLPDAAEPAPVGRAPEALPALLVEVSGQVTASNLAEFKVVALGAIRSVNRTLKTDQDFANAEKAVKWCAEVEARLKAAKEHALAQTADIDALFRALDEIAAESKAVRLDLDKLVTRRKTEVKEEAVAKARRALDEHIAGLNAEIAPMRLQPVLVDFAGAIKGLKSVASMQDRLDTTLAAAKIEADAAARVVRGNVATFQAEAAGFEFLFADLATFVHKASDDFRALVTARIATHRAAEERKERERQAAEAARIAEAEQRAREDERAAALARQREQEAAAEAVRVAQSAATATMDAPRPMPAAAAVDAPLPVAPAPAANDPPTLLLGAIAARLGFALREQFVSDVLGIQPASRLKSAVLYRESDFGRICAALVRHINAVRAGAAEPQRAAADMTSSGYGDRPCGVAST